jgi:hypothetical protein
LRAKVNGLGFFEDKHLSVGGEFDLDVEEIILGCVYQENLEK